MKQTKKTNRPFSASNRKGLLEDFFDFLFTVLLAFFAFSFVYIFMVESTNGDTEEKKVKSLDFATDLLYQTEGQLFSRAEATDISADFAVLDSAEKAIASSERGVLRRRFIGTEKPSRVLQQQLLAKTTPQEVATRELLQWNEGGLRETQEKGQQLVKKYWSYCSKERYDGSKPWSAAFISYVMKEAGFTEFPAHCAHLGYFTQIQKNPGKCITKPKEEISLLKEGDILCQCRGESCPLNYYALSEIVPAHCDVVVKVQEDTVEVVGGNLANSVITRKISKTDDKIFGFISCRK